jgi:hypothetical protein
VTSRQKKKGLNTEQAPKKEAKHFKPKISCDCAILAFLGQIIAGRARAPQKMQGSNGLV